MMLCHLKVSLWQHSLDEVGARKVGILELAASAVSCSEVGAPEVLQVTAHYMPEDKSTWQ